MKENILQLRSEGKTYNEIKSMLNCSKGTIAYYCGDGQKGKTKERRVKYRRTIKGMLTNRISYFLKRDDKNRLYDKNIIPNFTLDEFIRKFGYNTKCALTGIEIDLLNDKNWEIDHIIPKSKGGGNTLDNCQILLKEVNQMKHSLTEEKLFDYCRLILENKFGK